MDSSLRTPIGKGSLSLNVEVVERSIDLIKNESNRTYIVAQADNSFFELLTETSVIESVLGN